MQTRGRHHQQSAHKELVLGLAEESKSILLELGSILNQRYHNRGPTHQTQRVLQRKNELVSRLEQFVSEQQSSGDDGDAQEDPQATVEGLQKELQDQRAAFEQQQARLQQQATVTLNAQTELSSSLNRVLPQLRGLLDAYERERGQHVDLTQGTTTTAATANVACSARTVTLTQTSNSTPDLTQRLTDLQTQFDAERAQLLEQASDAANTQQDITRRNLREREAALTCPISLDLFEIPVVTECCGRTFSSEALAQALRRNLQCPVCRSRRVTSHASRDMANLVELHRNERLLLGLTDNAVASATTGTGERSVTEEGATESPSRWRRLARESQNRNQRTQRVQARAAVPHRQSSTTTPSNSSLTSNPPASNRGRRRGRTSNSRRRRSSRTSSSPTSTATPSSLAVSRTDTAPNATANATLLLSAMQSPSLFQSWRSSNTAPRSPMTSAVAPSRTDYSYIRAWMPRDVGSSPYRPASGSNPALTQLTSPARYGRGPEFGFYSNFGSYDSDSDY